MALSEHLPDAADAFAGQAIEVLRSLAHRQLTIATAESCTGGLLASLLTDQEGYGQWFDRGFVTYTDAAKSEALDVEPDLIARHGAVSEEVARAMAIGALARSHAGIAISITGFAGPGGPDDEEGLVYLAAVDRVGHCELRECHFGKLGRERIRNLAVQAALELARTAIERG